MTSESQARARAVRGLPSVVVTVTVTTRPIPTLPPSLPLPADVPEPEEWALIKAAFAGFNPGAVFQMVLVPRPVGGPLHPGHGLLRHGRGRVSARRKPAGAAVQECMFPASHALRTGTGALAEHVRVPARHFVYKPERGSFAKAGIMLPALTACQDGRGVGREGGRSGTGERDQWRDHYGGDGEECSWEEWVCCRDRNSSRLASQTKPFNAIIDTLGHQSIHLPSPPYFVPSGIYSSAASNLQTSAYPLPSAQPPR